MDPLSFHRFDGFGDLRIVRIWCAQPEIVGDRPDEHVNFLADQDDFVPKFGITQVVNRCAVDGDSPVPDGNDAGNQFGECGLSCTTAADDGDSFPRCDRDRDRIDHRGGVVVRVRNPLHVDSDGCGPSRGRNARGTPGHRGDTDQASQAGTRILQFVDVREKYRDGAEQTVEVERSGGSGPDGHRSRGHEPVADAQDRGQSEQFGAVELSEEVGAQSNCLHVEADGMLGGLGDSADVLVGST